MRIGDVVRLRKPHPCGGLDWTIVRIGADIGLRCLKCNHRVLIPRSHAERRIKGFLSRNAPRDPFAEEAALERFNAPRDPFAEEAALERFNAPRDPFAEEAALERVNPAREDYG